MLLKGIVQEDFLQYKKPSLFLIFPYCTWKCDKEAKARICQNSQLAAAPAVDVPAKYIVELYLKNDISKAVVCGGLEPFESFDDLYELIELLRERTNDDVVIYTGFYEEEIKDKIDKLKKFDNIIVKFGRYIPGQERHFDPVLGIELASDNQFAVKIN